MCAICKQEITRGQEIVVLPNGSCHKECFEDWKIECSKERRELNKRSNN